jgi:hypothetical protein
MVKLHIIVDAHILLAGMLSVQTASILLQGSLPGYGQGEYQSIKRRMIKALANQSASG